ncbi:hypothetical protein D3C87_1571680 [compost metagenome]
MRCQQPLPVIRLQHQMGNVHAAISQLIHAKIELSIKISQHLKIVLRIVHLAGYDRR